MLHLCAGHKHYQYISTCTHGICMADDGGRPMCMEEGWSGKMPPSLPENLLECFSENGENSKTSANHFIPFGLTSVCIPAGGPVYTDVYNLCMRICLFCCSTHAIFHMRRCPWLLQNKHYTCMSVCVVCS